MHVRYVSYFRSIKSHELLEKIQELNDDPKVHGIIVQMPLDCDEDINSDLITNAVSEEKDVDGLSSLNQGKIATGYLESAFTPCTPAGCLTLIESTGKELTGCNAVVIGRVEIKGEWEEGENMGDSNVMAEGLLLYDVTLCFNY